MRVYAGYTLVATAVVASGSAPSGPACGYEAPFTGRVPIDRDNDGVIEPDEYWTSFRDMTTRQFVDGPGPGIEMYVWRTCPPGDNSTGIDTWVPSPQAVDIDALIASAYERVRAQVPAPTININPPTDIGVAAQLGIWLAINDPGQLNVVAQVGPVWASATARHTSTTWNMGNGDTIHCNGTGTPYPTGADTLEQGPCGYTYTHPGDPGTRQVTATAHWDVQLTTSTGRNQTLDPITTTTTFDYDVYEIVTIVEG